MADAASRPITHDTGTTRVKRGLAEMLKGGVIMDVVDPDQAKIAEDAGAVAVMALERVPSDIRRDGGVARMSDPQMIKGIQAAVTIPVMAKARIGHFAEAQVLESLGQPVRGTLATEHRNGEAEQYPGHGGVHPGGVDQQPGRHRQQAQPGRSGPS